MRCVVKVRPLLGVASLPRLAGRVLITRPKLATKTDWPEILLIGKSRGGVASMASIASIASIASVASIAS